MMIIRENIDRVIQAIEKGNMQLAIQEMRTYKIPFNALHTRMEEIGMSTWNIAVLADMEVSYLKHND